MACPSCAPLTPEARAGIEAVLAKTAAPGMCNPRTTAPVVDGSPDDETIQRDTRSAAQRSHDGLSTPCDLWHT